MVCTLIIFEQAAMVSQLLAESFCLSVQYLVDKYYEKLRFDFFPFFLFFFLDVFSF